MSYQNVKDYRQRLKERATYVMGEKCQCCGYNRCITALEFHHLDPNQKDFSFGSNTNRSWENTKEELKKCILVCANCHREIHNGLIDNLSLSSSFDVEKAKEIDALVEAVKKKDIFYCKKCGVEIWRGSTYCPTCAKIESRLVERPNRIELKKLIRTTPFTKLGEKFGVSDNAIRKWCIAEGLPSKSTEIKKYTDKEWELL